MGQLTKPVIMGIDWKGLGYLTSIASVFFLGAVAIVSYYVWR